MVPQDKWRWFGDAGHFCGSRNCEFHLCTKVGDWLVSTVGKYAPALPRSPREEFKYTIIGLDRLYETMVFKAGKPCSEASCDCGLPERDGSVLGFSGYNSAGRATVGHLEWCMKAARGEISEWEDD